MPTQQSVESAFVSIQRGHLPAIWPTWWPWNRIDVANLATDEVSEGFVPVSILWLPGPSETGTNEGSEVKRPHSPDSSASASEINESSC